MFDWITGKGKENNVVPFPIKDKTQDTPKSEQKPVTVFYRFGITDSNRLAFQMGYSEITLNKQGVQCLIDQLEFYKSQLTDEGDEDL